APWIELDSGSPEADAVAARLRWWSAVTDLDLIHYGTKADADTIRDTAVAQPLLVAAGLAAAAAVFPDARGADGLADAASLAGVFAGHGVGELTVAAL